MSSGLCAGTVQVSLLHTKRPAGGADLDTGRERQRFQHLYYVALVAIVLIQAVLKGTVPRVEFSVLGYQLEGLL